jgi:hypothetical protein
MNNERRIAEHLHYTVMVCPSGDIAACWCEAPAGEGGAE